MTASEIDLKRLLLQDQEIALKILGESYKLAIEVESTHFWLVKSLETTKTLAGIGANVNQLFDALEGSWDKGQAVFNGAEGLKLWKTAVGLWRALVPMSGKITEQLSRRRRQRIMGDELIEPDDLDEQIVAGEKAELKKIHGETVAAFSKWTERIEKIPAGLAPTVEQETGETQETDQAQKATEPEDLSPV